jgi:hypothetical protein
MATISKGITLSYKQGEGEFVVLDNLQEIAELGGEVEAIEITTLADAAHMYTDGIKSYGDSLGFKFLYEKAQFTTLNGIKDSCEWKVALPDGTTCTFGGTCSVKLDGVGVNAVLTYSLNIKPNSEMLWA